MHAKICLLLALTWLFGTGCAHRRSGLTAELTDEVIERIESDGATTTTTRHTERRDLQESATAAGDAKNVMEKFRASNAAKTQSVGFEGAEQEISATNVVRALEAMRDTAKALSPK